MAAGVFMRHQTSNNVEVQNKTTSETNAQGTLLLKPQGDGQWELPVPAALGGAEGRSLVFLQELR